MNKYRMTWWQKPYARYSPKVLFVEAASEEEACDIAVDHIERKHGIPRSNFSLQNVSEAESVPAGRVFEE